MWILFVSFPFLFLPTSPFHFHTLLFFSFISFFKGRSVCIILNAGLPFFISLFFYLFFFLFLVRFLVSSDAPFGFILISFSFRFFCDSHQAGPAMAFVWEKDGTSIYLSRRFRHGFSSQCANRILPGC